METVLIVEDDATMLRGLKDNFEFAGYRVLTAADGEDGLNPVCACSLENMATPMGSNRASRRHDLPSGLSLPPEIILGLIMFSWPCRSGPPG